MVILIRKASEQDANVLASLNADVQAVHAAATPWRFKPPGPDTLPACFKDIARREQNLIIGSFLDRPGSFPPAIVLCYKSQL